MADGKKKSKMRLSWQWCTRMLYQHHLTWEDTTVPHVLCNTFLVSFVHYEASMSIMPENGYERPLLISSERLSCRTRTMRIGGSPMLFTCVVSMTVTRA